MADLLTATSKNIMVVSSLSTSKKRKASNASTTSSQQSTATVNAQHSSSTADQSSSNDESASRSTYQHQSQAPREERRLPAKKRRGSLDEEATKRRHNLHTTKSASDSISDGTDSAENNTGSSVRFRDSSVNNDVDRFNNGIDKTSIAAASSSVKQSLAAKGPNNNVDVNGSDTESKLTGMKPPPSRIHTTDGNKTVNLSIMEPPPARGRSNSVGSLSIIRKNRKDSYSDSSSSIRKSSLDLVAFDQVPRKESIDSYRLEDVLLPPVDTSLDYKALEPLPVHNNVQQSKPKDAAAVAVNDTASSLLTKPKTESKQDHQLVLPPLNLHKHADDDSSAASSGQRLLLEAAIFIGDHASKAEGRGRERLDSWGDRAYLLNAVGGGRERLDSWDATMQHNFSRERLESWGGMSDLSVPFLGMGAGSASLTAMSSEDEKPSALIPNKIDLQEHQQQYQSRSRKNSLASLSEGSFIGDMSDIQAFVAAAVAASVGDQLAELAGAVELAAETDWEHSQESNDDDQNSNSDSDHAIRYKKKRPRSLSQLSASGNQLAVDFEAISAAVYATRHVEEQLGVNGDGIQLLASDSTESEDDENGKVSNDKIKAKRPQAKRKLPLSKNPAEENPDTASSGNMTKAERKRIKDLTRATAKPIAPKSRKNVKSKNGPVKKRVKRNSPEPELEKEPSPGSTPKQSNKTLATPEDIPMLPLSAFSADVAVSAAPAEAATKSSGCSKWDGMYEVLLRYVEEKREEELKDLPSEEHESWVWDGNVPTTYKTKDGKPLGRWVNNQRTAKSKGQLKTDREERLVDAGLKWSVVTESSWFWMYDELRAYINEHTKEGQPWDGNVPTNYQIKSKGDGKFKGEDKNLGRWVNRQRSAYRDGKLRKDRQEHLEKIGLKWSMLAMNSWESMFEALREFADQKKKTNRFWDGNVPVNYSTSDDPPKKLGRWVNRQRSAYSKGKLKKEYVSQLAALGLKWNLHERNDYF